MCVEKRKWSNKYAYLTIPSPPSQTALPINHQRVPLQSTSIRIPTSSCTNTACSCKGIGVGDADSGTEMLQLLSSRVRHTPPPGFSPERKRPAKKILRSRFTMHALTTYHWALIGRSNRCKEGTALNIHCIPMHLAISSLDLVNV